MTLLGRALADRIRSEGPLSVEACAEACNTYYYATRDPLGADGDFTTAPEIHQMFGEMVGAALADVCSRRQARRRPLCGVGGRGTLANDALRVMRRAGSPARCTWSKPVPSLRETQARLLPEARFHDDIASLPEAPVLLAANEFFGCAAGPALVDGLSAISPSLPVVLPSTAMAQLSNNRRLAKKLRN